MTRTSRWQAFSLDTALPEANSAPQSPRPADQCSPVEPIVTHQVHAKIILLQKLENLYIPLEWIEDIINAIAYYSILRNATAHMHRESF